MRYNSVTSIVALTIFFSSQLLFGQSAPTISPSEDQEVLTEQTGTISLSASGGTTKSPSDDEGCPPWTLYSTKTIWVYSGLTGTPASGTPSDSSTLGINKNTGGKADVKAKIENEYKDSKGNSKKETSPESSSVSVSIQVPTSITFVSGTISGAGGAYKFLVKDQNGKAIKNGNVQLLESFAAHPIEMELAGGQKAPANFSIAAANDDVAAAGPTDASGYIVDAPVTMGELSELEDFAQQYYDGDSRHFKIVKLIRKYNHKYKLKYGNTVTSELLDQPHEIIVEIEWDANNKPKAKVGSVSPAN